MQLLLIAYETEIAQIKLKKAGEIILLASIYHQLTALEKLHQTGSKNNYTTTAKNREENIQILPSDENS